MTFIADSMTFLADSMTFLISFTGKATTQRSSSLDSLSIHCGFQLDLLVYNY